MNLSQNWGPKDTIGSSWSYIPVYLYIPLSLCLSIRSRRLLVNIHAARNSMQRMRPQAKGSTV